MVNMRCVLAMVRTHFPCEFKPCVDLWCGLSPLSDGTIGRSSQNNVFELGLVKFTERKQSLHLSNVHLSVVNRVTGCQCGSLQSIIVLTSLAGNSSPLAWFRTLLMIQCSSSLHRILLVAVSIFSLYSVHLLLKTANEGGSLVYEQLGYKAFGMPGKLAASISITMQNIGGEN